MDNFFNNIQNMDPQLLQHIINSLVLNNDVEVIEDNSDNTESDKNENNKDSEDNCITVNNTDVMMADDNHYGCKHYLRRCKIVSPCCNELYSCRLCHDEEKYDLIFDGKNKHKLDRFKISEVICANCDTKQQVQQYCQSCNACFGLYYCDICHLFDDIDKEQFHCYGCGFCRIGGKDNFVHCDKCNMCIVKTIFETHKCLNIIETLCPICMSDLFTSTIGVIQMKCGHYIHSKCFSELLNTSYKCPMCSASIVETNELNKIIDAEVNATAMPEDYKDIMIKILCNDCHKESNVKFHIVGLKCQECGGYNTRKI